jgi:hypothetical protein
VSGVDATMKYRYHRFGKHLVCQDQSIFDAVRTLGIRHDRCRLDSLGVSRSAARRAIKVVTKGKLRLLNQIHQVCLPVFGHLAMQVHRGYKVFNFNNMEVAKVFSHEVSARDAEKEIAASRQASEVATAPEFLQADPALAWFKEEYIRGTHATQLVSGPDSDFLNFYADVELCLLSLVGSKSPSQIRSRTHIESLAGTAFRTNWLNAGIAAGDVDGIVEYIAQLGKWLAKNSEPDQLQLVMTHGDFSLVNAISTDAGLRFIDWEGIAPGGLYSDIFNFLFVERYYGRSSPRFLGEVSEFLANYRQSVLSRFPELHPAAALEPTFARRLYYLERMSLLVGRDASANLRDVVCKTIEMFRDFDKQMGDSAT